ncbi:helix-turn-helix transcriptional regulator [Saccharopolyspora sp. 5N708]|uniref:helix-turn-helix transcriptional regulator n=1 Tax=Saccharopolyspora sp. 5N708 TaxID=3457424 RepID=UPI003FD45B5C
MPDVATEAARFITAHSAERIKLTDVADHVGYSPFHLARSFERQLGMPPGQFLAAHRFQRAKQLLLADDDRIIDICFAVGFTSVGTFTRRFTADVGVCPTAFRRLPDSLADAPPKPVHIPGSVARGGIVTGTVHLSAAALAALRDTAAVYVGLFPRRAPRGIPISGSLLDETGDFALTGIPPGNYWLLSTAFAARAEAPAQLVPAWNVVGGSPRPVRVSARAPWHHRDVHLDVAAEWTAPVLVALPPLASPIAQDRRRQSRQPALH